MRIRSRSLLAAMALLGAVALARCSSSSSPPAQNGSVLSCTLPPAAASAAAPPIQVFSLGTMKVGATSSFTLPPSAASFTIVEQVVSAVGTATFKDFGTVPNSAQPLRITDPTGRVVLDQFQNPADPTQALLFDASSSPGTGTVTLPDTTAGLQWVASGLPAGTWSFEVSDLAHLCTLASNCAAGGGSNSGAYDVTVIVKPSAGAGNIPASGTLDLTLNLTSAGLVPPLSAATASGDADLQRMLTTLTDLLGQAQLRLGTVRYVDVPTAVAARIASGVQVDDATACGELSQLMATAPPGRQVNVFLVPGFLSSGAPPGTLLAGIDGTIPGPSTVSPTLESGAAVNAANLRANPASCNGGFTSACGADRVAYVIAHEMGHYLGLYHVTEMEGTSFDPLQDTPTCACQTCAADKSQCADASPAPGSPHQMAIAECTPGSGASSACGGGDNLMFWLFGPNSRGTLSSQQSEVMRASPAVY